MRQIKLTHVSFWAHVKIASRIVSTIVNHVFPLLCCWSYSWSSFSLSPPTAHPPVVISGIFPVISQSRTNWHTCAVAKALTLSHLYFRRRQVRRRVAVFRSVLSQQQSRHDRQTDDSQPTRQYTEDWPRLTSAHCPQPWPQQTKTARSAFELQHFTQTADTG